MLIPGDPLPSFHVRSLANPNYAFDTVAGRHVVITFIGSTRIAGVPEYLDRLKQRTDLFDDFFASLFIVSSDPEDEKNSALADRYPGYRVIWDGDRKLAGLFGCAQEQDANNGRLALTTWILDPGLRVLDLLPIENLATHHELVCAKLAKLTPPALSDAFAPVLVVPNVLEPEFCKRLLDYYAEVGGDDSGYMSTDPATGKTVLTVNHYHKRREDCLIKDNDLRDGLQARVYRRLVPAIQRAFQFKVSRMERYLISRYSAETEGHFRPHKDNTTLGTAHRRFAASIGLNADNYEGGDLRFPEFGSRTYRPPTGGAVVFSCSLLHEAQPVTKGERYVVLPFLYDEAAANIRLENAQHIEDPRLRSDVIASVTAVPRRA